MKITVLGWYGTETIGDRAILAGIFSFFSKAFGSFQVNLGSLNPFFSERTIDEDEDLWFELSHKKINITLFDSKKHLELEHAIRRADLVIMGGGPLMHVNPIFMVEYAFKKAKKLGKKTAVIGCGIGPAFEKKYRKAVLEIIKNSDLIILRDKKSKDNLVEIFKFFNISIDKENIFSSCDPSVECVLNFHKLNQSQIKDYIAINLRMFPIGYSRKDLHIDDYLKKIVIEIASKYSDREIKLIPMHYFHIGNDDRQFLNEILQDGMSENMIVQNRPLTLVDTMKVFQKAYFNVGMRFHSVVLQTILSGRNYILDYTEPKKGKIIGFLNDIDKKGFYHERYINLQEDKLDAIIIQNEKICFEFDENMLEKMLGIYSRGLKELVHDTDALAGHFQQ